MPPGEVYLTPQEDSASGVVVVDGSIGGIGLIDKPISIRFENGRPVEISDPTLKKLLEPHGFESLRLAEFGIGTNPQASIVGNFLEDEKAIGVTHFTIGSRRSTGKGVPIHVNLVLRDAMVKVDGKAIPKRFLSPPAPAPSDAMLPEKPANRADSFAQRLRNEVKRHRFLDTDGKPLSPLTISLGVASLGSGCTDAETLIKLADARLYEAKQRGRDCVVADSNATTVAAPN